MIEIVSTRKNEVITVGNDRFPDGTSMLLSLDKEGKLDETLVIQINWRYESEDELVKLIYISKHLRDIYPKKSQRLYMPYIPNARMDRVKNAYEVFTLKWFAEVINSLGFDIVYVLDPHSNVSTALIDRVCVIDAGRVFAELKLKYDFNTVYFPDESAYKRYSEYFPVGHYGILYGKKKRDWNTGQILGVETVSLTGEPVKKYVKNRKILVVDDIISKGGSIYYGLNNLYEYGDPQNVTIYATHVEDSIYSEKLWNTYISGKEATLVTTDSIVHKFPVDEFTNFKIIKTFIEK